VLVRLVLLLVVVGILAAGAGLGWTWLALERPHAGWQGEAVEVVLEPGVDAGTALRRLAAAGVVRHPRFASAWLTLRGRAGRIHAGEYRFDAPLSLVEVLERLERGEVILHPVTLPEGLNFVEIATRLERAGFGPREGFIEVFRNPAPVRDLDPEALDLEGYLFPDTYHFPRGETAERIAAAMVDRFREVMGPAFGEEAVVVGLSLRQAVILASMIEKETSVVDERERISQVFHNRMKRGMKLECDPTVIYALERAGRAVERLTYDDLRFDSPWNTYAVAGLPRGPIANPGSHSLWAALRPSTGNDRYFVAAPGGGHTFSESLDGHLRAVAEWRRHVRSSR
jgi:UPF0755 protein